MSEHDDFTRALFMRNLWRWSCGRQELPTDTVRWTAAQRESNWFPAFVELMRNRMRLGIYRYGHFRDPGQAIFDRVGSMQTRLRLYQRDGNAEHLLDIANLCGIEFERKDHPRWHFTPMDDQVHTEAK